MRLEARVTEGGKVRKALVPLRTVLAFSAQHDRTLNDAIARGDFVEWEPWVCWHVVEGPDGRTFDDWCQQVDWCGVYNAPDALDPSGGEAVGSTSPESPSSPPAPPADGKPSSASPTTSKTPSGEN